MNSATTDTAEVRRLLKSYADLLLEYNTRVNLISRKSKRDDVEAHIAHCLSILSKPFADGTHVIDWGSGGGLPAIPIAIACPNVNLTAVETTGKKAVAIQHFAEELALDNLTVWRGRAEQFPGKFNYSVSRATAPLLRLWSWHIRGDLPASVSESERKPGLLALKGGDLDTEIRNLKSKYPRVVITREMITEINGKAAEDKYLVHVTRRSGGKAQ